MLSVTWAELCRDLSRAIEFDQSHVFQKVYSDEFGMPGGEPFGVLIGDYEVRHTRSREHPTDDIAGLRGMAHVAAAAFAPFITGCAPAMLGLDDFGALSQPLNLPRTFQLAEYAAWRAFQEMEDARFVGITLPRVLMRLPYADDGSRGDGFRFHEDVEGSDLGRYLWGPAAYAFAGVLIRAFSHHGWFAEIRGTDRDVEEGGIVEGLPVQSFGTDRPGVAIKYSTDVSVSERQEMELSELGFIPLSKCKDTEYSAFFSNQSAHRPKTYDRSVATMNARLSSMLQYILCVSRFSHYIKVIGRDRTGSFASAEELQQFIYNWLFNYVTSSPGGSLDQRARYPLSEAGVQVRELPGRPGTFTCIAHLKPHFQLDQVTSSFRLVTELPSPQAR